MRIVALPLTFLFTTLVVAQAPGARRQAAAPAAPPAQSATVPLSNYQRAAGLQARFAGKTLDAIDAPVWLASGKLAYRKTVRDGSAFIIVDPATGAKTPAFDTRAPRSEPERGGRQAVYERQTPLHDVQHARRRAQRQVHGR